MCNRYRMSAKTAEVARKFGVPEHMIMPEPEPLPPPELFPKRVGWVVRNEGAARVLDTMTWGVPFNGKPITNVRNLQSNFWRSMLKTPANRCLVPVTDFCEWEGAKGAKVARWFSLPSETIFAFAGIWRQTEIGKAYAFLTCEPNPLVESIHPKAMPVILHPEDYGRWLEGETEDACSLAQPFPSQLMVVT